MAAEGSVACEPGPEASKSGPRGRRAAVGAVAGQPSLHAHVVWLHARVASLAGPLTFRSSSLQDSQSQQEEGPYQTDSSRGLWLGC